MRRLATMNQHHLALIYTGGTIGMTKTAAGYAPMPDFPERLQAMLAAVDADGNLPRYTLIRYPQPIDSANATPADWQTIGRDIAARYAAFDGFVVLHGTDTMAYTASALSFMLQGLRKPVIVTGSQIPLEAVRTDALQNLVGALQLAADGRLNEVAIYFGQRLLRGNRSSKLSTEALAAFASPNYPALAEVGIEPRWDTGALLAATGAERFELPDYGAATVLALRFAPGMPQ
jgi:L-asparaginase